MISDSSLKGIKYFAAANGYGGFRSLFGEIFAPEKFDRTFIIKGGPGTGKSTLMRELIRHAMDEGYRHEEIYCSSDPDSLDGVIIKHGSRSVAILDGTTPHQRDAIYPGACDEIVNLGEGFDTIKLREHKEEIIELTRRKKDAYKLAYAHLSAAGKIYEVAKEILSKSLIYSKAECEISGCVQYEAQTKSPDLFRVYRSSFSKDGYRRISECSGKETIKIDTSQGAFAARIIMGMIYRKMMDKNSVYGVALSPFDDSIIEDIEADERIYSLSPREADIYPSSLFKGDMDDIRLLEKMHGEVLELAKSSFSDASRSHFALEDIYKNSVDFSNNERICSRIKDRIVTELEKQ